MRRKLIMLACLMALVISAGPAAAFDLGSAIGTVVKAVKVGHAVHKATKVITPEQEYYIGRAVGAQLLGRYKPFTGPELNRYLNRVGLALAAASDMPDTFGGYHFMALDTDEINAFACPGGLILVSRGLIGLCRDESDLAAVLAHEIGHVQYRHGIDAIKKGRLTEIGKSLALDQFASAGGAGAAVVGLFGDTVGDVVGALAETGYSRSQEYEADQAAIVITARTGYDPRGLVRVLEAMKARQGNDKAGFFATHPDPADRIADLIAELESASGPAPSPVRAERFALATAKP